MAQLSYINTGVRQASAPKLYIPTDESVGGMLFDISGFSNPFDGYPLLYSCFKGGAVQLVRNLDDATLLGIEDDGFMNGILYHHLSQFYDFVGGNQTLYVAIADCSLGWDAVQSMQQQTNGKLFHVGVWTSQPIWKFKHDGSLGFTPLITDLQRQANELNGAVGSATHASTPVSIILCGNGSYAEGGEIDFRHLPDAIELNCPKVSVVLGQNGSGEAHQMQERNPLHAPVGALGLVMACLSLCGAEESIASLGKCDLNKNEGFNYPEWGVGSDNAQIGNIHRMWANTISNRGYIIPVDYEGLEASYFLSSDNTLSDGDYGTIANNRVMHKCRRAVCTALLPYINSDQLYDPGTRSLSVSATAFITDSVNSILDAAMKNRQGFSQIEGRQLTFLDDADILDTGSVSAKLKIKPANYSGYIEEEVAHDFA